MKLEKAYAPPKKYTGPDDPELQYLLAHRDVKRLWRLFLVSLDTRFLKSLIERDSALIQQRITAEMNKRVEQQFARANAEVKGRLARREARRVRLIRRYMPDKIREEPPGVAQTRKREMYGVEAMRAYEIKDGEVIGFTYFHRWSVLNALLAYLKGGGHRGRSIHEIRAQFPEFNLKQIQGLLQIPYGVHEHVTPDRKRQSPMVFLPCEACFAKAERKCKVGRWIARTLVSAEDKQRLMETYGRV